MAGKAHLWPVCEPSPQPSTGLGMCILESPARAGTSHRDLLRSMVRLRTLEYPRTGPLSITQLRQGPSHKEQP